MPLAQELPDYTYSLRSADGRSARVNEQVLTTSFVLAPEMLLPEWDVVAGDALQPEDLAPLLELRPELILLGTGSRQVFPAPETMAACLGKGVGLEVMANDAAARTYNILASEGRRVVAGFMLDA
ncbi:MAG: Mth938-like domain-containing protein [Pseudoxanthomonas sp.]